MGNKKRKEEEENREEEENERKDGSKAGYDKEETERGK